MDEVLNTIQSKLETLQEELKQLRTTTVTTNKSNDDEPSEFDQARDRLMTLMREDVSNANHKIVAVSMYTTSVNGGTSSVSHTIMNDHLYGIDEEKMATVCEIFSNPRRIKIIMSLIESPLYANEISQKTGFVGGQLYHHLNILEDAELIKKENDKYSTSAITIGMLTTLWSVIMNVKIGEEKLEEEEK